MKPEFRTRVQQAIADPQLQIALDGNAERRKRVRDAALAELDDLQASRTEAAAIRSDILDSHPQYLERFIMKLREHGIHVHRAKDAVQARTIILEICRHHGARLVAKSKSMVTEEIEINHALEEEGIRVVETDLGEFIVQLRGEKPAHIITPAVHLRREDVAATFVEKLGMTYTTDVKAMTDVARRELRDVFLQADVGISGANFGVVENGALVLLTNEGNGRMVTTVPGVHIAVMGVERLVPTMADLAVLLDLLPRSATGQKITSYVSLLQRDRQADPDGPEERHVVLLDNGRTALLDTEFRDILRCIRCGACLNACPVYREIGGHAYGSVYPGPIGSVLSPGLFGVAQFGHLAKASTLCGACADACPVKINLPELLLRIRRRFIAEAPQPAAMKLGMRFYRRVVEQPALFHAAQRLAGLGAALLPKRRGWLPLLPPPAAAWTAGRDFPPPARRPFHTRWQQLAPAPVHADHSTPQRPPDSEAPAPAAALSLADEFENELRRLDGEVIRCSTEDAAEKVSAFIHGLGIERVACWEQADGLLSEICSRLAAEGVHLETVCIPHEPAGRKQAYASLEKVRLGITGAAAGFARTGTLVLPAGSGKPQSASLVPEIHLVLLQRGSLHASLADWLQAGGWERAAGTMVSLVSGPSRTADIEMTLTVGVHGPGRVVVLLLD